MPIPCQELLLIIIWDLSGNIMIRMSGSDDLDEIEAPQLSAETFKALQEFYDDQERREQELQALQALSSSDVKQFEENWQLSQFWYSEETASKLAAECFRQVLGVRAAYFRTSQVRAC